ncbi:hypothetical protein PCC7424_0272 [Gloeothece citriformis PCC 7424]|uniref:Uncharacterized protein n=1 Tax=Gloeothece citriformis (strain PCC 7424) TaxID=65393 RepID=B7KAR8_GLOC7|nr:hypothetical protein [Gloeothece citriformis]ACK68740.1 hypothetical protein PCC7424_0272 [Gloeothece citriformis PCC 7424]
MTVNQEGQGRQSSVSQEIDQIKPEDTKKARQGSHTVSSENAKEQQTSTTKPESQGRNSSYDR